MRNPNPQQIDSTLQNFHSNKRFKAMKNNLQVKAIQAKDMRPTVGSVSVIGRRRVMEDALATEKLGPYNFFGIYDGHGGASVANACRDRLHKLLEKEYLACLVRGVVDWERVMASCFLMMDREVGGAQANSEESRSTVGSTAVVAVVGKQDIVVANCGDSRAVLFSDGVAVPLSRDHKPDRPDEKGRVEAAGGRIIDCYGSRVLGVLATSRSIGDHYLKPYVISEPEVTIWKRTGLDSFLIMASDGLWDVVSNEFACKIVNRCLHGQNKRRDSDDLNGSAVEAAALLAELAIARGSRDNVSIIVVELNK